MSENDNPEVNAVLETVTSTIRSLVNLVDTAVATLGSHTQSLNGLAELAADQADTLRVLESKAYALEQDLAELRREHESLKERHETLARAHLVHDHGSLRA